MPFWVEEKAARRAIRHLLMVLFGAFAMTLAACGSKPLPANVAYQPADFGQPDAEPAEIARGEAKIAPLDKLDIKVFQVEDLSGEFQVNSAGQISFPLVGAVAASGRTPVELARTIEAQLGGKYLKNPKVQVNIKEAEAVQRTVTVDGSVKDPGAFPVQGPISLMRAVALAKGLSDNADPKRVIVFRTVNGQRMAGGFDLTAIRRAQAEDPVVYPNDIVVVDGRDARLYSTFKEVLGTLPILALFRPF